MHLSHPGGSPLTWNSQILRLGGFHMLTGELKKLMGPNTARHSIDVPTDPSPAAFLRLWRVPSPAAISVVRDLNLKRGVTNTASRKSQGKHSEAEDIRCCRLAQLRSVWPEPRDISTQARRVLMAVERRAIALRFMHSARSLALDMCVLVLAPLQQSPMQGAWVLSPNKGKCHLRL
jgi:hypothetical protein